MFVNLDANVKTAADGGQLGDFGVLHGDRVSDDENVQVKFALLIGRQQTQSEVEDGQVTDSTVEDWTVNIKVIVAEKECEDKTDDKEGVCDVSGRLNLEMTVHVKCEEKKGRRIDFFGKELDEMFLDFFCNFSLFHLGLSNNYFGKYA